ncbi:SRPBCC family protein [Chitinophaga japonensis]|uniref:Activator of Hsp90 ATPase-like protein n=1 Tax=Chitinophaga japonensis TaxID=104662 RepID=A0A562TFW0_CHIJA|nr:SRPBCC domain-containing protein [Chitinophaga japonensis]TWI92154.1 activator of Hsp90 ATPase-like protein [Chitinophaga japonensis]
MKKLEFKINIAANPQKVWDTMLNLETYQEWVGVSWPGSTYKGEWKQGQELRFVSTEGGGTLAKVEELQPQAYIFAKHIAVINNDGTEDRSSEIAQGWIGTTEAYTFTESNGGTELKVELHTSPEWESMFNEGWPDALAKLKEICERP